MLKGWHVVASSTRTSLSPQKRTAAITRTQLKEALRHAGG